MACINPNDPAYQEILARVGNPILAEIEFDKQQQIKSGVEKLFESNPELANQVYEASGFINSQELENLKKEFSSFSNQRDKFKGDLKNTKNLVDVLGQVAADSNFYKPFATDISEQRKKDIISGKATSYIFEDNFDTYRKTIKKSLEDELKSEADRYNYWFDDDTNFYTFDVDSGKYYKYDSNETFTPLEKKYEITKKEYYNSLDNYKNDLEQKNIQEQEDVKENVLRQPFLEGRIVRLFDNHFVIVTDHTIKEKGDSFINEIEFIYYDEFDYDRLKKLEKQEVTPKQKEQAIQQYSQYLNSIFPDSKVKDIVYHGAMENLLPQDGKFKGYVTYFTDTKRYAETFGFPINRKVVSAVIDIKSPYNAPSELADVPEEVHLTDQYTNPRIIKANAEEFDSVIGIDAGQEEGRTIAVFEPEQIHILGTQKDINDFKDFLNDEQPLYQLSDSKTISSQASPKTIAIVKDFLTRIGVDFGSVKEIVVNGQKIDANGVARITQALVQVLEGKEATALPEEAMHFAVEIIQQTNPKLFNQLLKEINSYSVYNEVLAEYSKNKYYQTKDGKPDILKLKKEAIGKVLAETIIKQSEGFTERPELLTKVQTWWQKILDIISNLFAKSGFDRFAMDILSGKEIGTVNDLVKTKSEEIYLQQDPQQKVIDDLKSTSAKIEKRDEVYYIDDKKINRRVTELVDDWYRRRYGDNSLLKSEYQTAVDDLKAEKGTAGHNDFEHAAKLYLNEDGSLKTKDEMDAAEIADVYQSLINPSDQSMYELLRTNMRQRLESFPSGTKFLLEQKIYDPNRNIAGAVDFLAITPEGKVSILDWKFMNLNTDLYTDVPWYKVLAWQIQMNQYKLILQNAYGVKSQDFEQTRMIPIQAIYSEQNSKTGELPRLLSIKIGDVNVKNITDGFLLPVALKDEKTGKRKIDELITKLNALYENISSKSVTDEEKLAKNEQLNTLFTAIRRLQIQQDITPLIRQAQVLIVSTQSIINKYEQKYKDRDPKNFKNQEINDFSGEIQDSLSAIDVYTKLYSNLKEIIQDDPDSAELLEDLRKVSDKAIDFESELQYILREFTANITAKKENVSNLLLPEKVIKGITKLFSTTSKLQTKSIQFIYKKANKAFGYSAQDTLTESKKLIELKKNYDAWAKSKGLSLKNYFNLIKKKDSNELIDQYNPEFYTLLKDKTKNKDYEWVRENIDVPAYNAHLREELQKEVDRLINKPRILTQDEQDGLDQYRSSGNEVTLPREIQLEIYNARALYNTSTTTSPGWLLTKQLTKFPNKDKWTTSEWAELNNPENAPAKEFYDYIIEKNAEYADLNYISKGDVNTFLPFVRKSLAEKFVIGGDIRLGEQFFRSISVDEGDVGYGELDKLTGKPINKIPKYFTNELDGETSDDLFRTMAFYNESAIRYKYLKEIEKQISAVLAVERNKQSIATSVFGKSRIENGELKYNDENNENSKLAEAMMRAIIYNQRYLESDTFDQLLGKLGKWGETFNSKMGVKIFPENLSERQMSINKVIDQLNNTFQLTTLGLNVLSASSNFFGGNAQSIINAGVYFTKTDYLAAEGMIFMDKFSSQDQKKMIGALEYFLPLTENYNREIAKSLSLNKLSQENIQDFLMILMRKTDLNVQTANFYAYLKNSIVVDGRVENAREYIRAQPKYADKYSVSVEERKTLEEEFEKDVKKLVDEQGVLTLGKVENDEFVIPGVDRKDDSVLELRRKVQQLSKDALGNLSEDDLRMINMTVYGKSFMIFKNWIPRLAEVRLGNLQYDSASDAYEWGRVRTVFSIMSKDILGSLGNLRNSLVANDKGVDFLRKLYEEKAQEHKQETGEDLNMTEAQFIDLVRKNVRNQMYDVIFYITLFILVAGIKGLPDDEEDPIVKNQYKFIVKAADKFKDEIAYFYDPTSISTLFSKGLFPSLGLVDNFTKLFKNFMIENWALATGDEETVKKNQVIKYLMKSFPISNQMVGYLPMFYPELAKDMGIKMQKNYGIR